MTSIVSRNNHFRQTVCMIVRYTHRFTASENKMTELVYLYDKPTVWRHYILSEKNSCH